MQTLIWIDKGVAAENKTHGREDPAIIVHSPAGRFRCRSVRGDGWRLVQNSAGGPVMGATVWVEVDEPGSISVEGRKAE